MLLSTVSQSQYFSFDCCLISSSLYHIYLVLLVCYIVLGFVCIFQNLVWSFGMNKSVPVLNMTDEERSSIVYACAHTAVMYDFKNNQQMLLQGHVSSNIIQESVSISTLQVFYWFCFLSCVLWKLDNVHQKCHNNYQF